MEKLDILNRKEFVDKLVNLTENISANKTSTSFAINGVWGCGKSFVLDMYEERLSKIPIEEKAIDKYFVIRYNCWKYDYYEEPLVAIVSTIIEAINDKIKLLTEEKHAKLKGKLVATGKVCFSVVSEIAKNKLGIDLSSIADATKTIDKEITSQAERLKDVHSYDTYFQFKKVLDELKNTINELAEESTIVFMVDELDRCLPEYAIKVLERLHHLTEDSSNVITVLAMDKTQLESSVERIFGYKNPEKYLEKFIQFEVKLGCGEISDKITEKHSDYIDMFDKDLFEIDDSIEEFIQAIFSDIDARTQEHVVKRATVAHRLLYTDKKDYVFMCMELLLAVLICAYDDNSCFNNSHIKWSASDKSNEEIFVSSSQNKPLAFSAFFKEKYDNIFFRIEHSFHDEPRKYVLPTEHRLYSAVLYTWYWMHEKHPRVVFSHYRDDIYEPIAKHYVELKKFAETIKMLK